VPIPVKVAPKPTALKSYLYLIHSDFCNPADSISVIARIYEENQEGLTVPRLPPSTEARIARTITASFDGRQALALPCTVTTLMELASAATWAAVKT
jgi:hypothetical protein